MRKYWTVFKTSWARELEYRSSFLLNRVYNLFPLLVLFYVWKAISASSPMFASFTTDEIFTYVFGVNLLRAVIFGSPFRSRDAALEINDGTFSVYLLKPLNHFRYVFVREAAPRVLNLLSSILEVGIFMLIIGGTLVWPTNAEVWIFFVFSIVGAVALFFLMTYLVSLVAFWSRESMGPRFLFDWILEMTSGAYYPLHILFSWLFAFLTFLPFAYLFYFPMMLYLGKMPYGAMVRVIAMQVIWMVGIAVVLRYVWREGLKRYSGEGI